ncbi:MULTISPECIES: hypothetical protein [unclassified Plantibacter]|uniref:hypothetical protein n=1 Tax=unclassified Plantibacter TaxID=2624265 RepID=UPI000AB50644|nr:MULTISPECIES: hypothetical protein [unclassified Plantibacter]
MSDPRDEIDDAIGDAQEAISRALPDNAPESDDPMAAPTDDDPRPEPGDGDPADQPGLL